MTAKTKSWIQRVSTAENLDDVESINQFFNSPKVKQGLHWFTYRDTLVRAFESENRQLMYIENDDEEIIGSLMVWCESRVLNENEAQIRLVAVLPDHREKGIGRSICTCAESFAKEKAKSRMIADVVSSSDAVQFWQAIGYEIIEEWQTNGGRKMLTMQKILS